VPDNRDHDPRNEGRPPSRPGPRRSRAAPPQPAANRIPDGDVADDGEAEGLQGRGESKWRHGRFERVQRGAHGIASRLAVDPVWRRERALGTVGRAHSRGSRGRRSLVVVQRPLWTADGEATEGVTVIWDRRLRERRKTDRLAAVDRRRRHRRRLPNPWSVLGFRIVLRQDAPP
jgi:hypothetical protein